MKILVPCKRVPDTDAKIRARPDASGIDETQLSHMLNPFDAIALEEALRIRELDLHSDSQIVAVSIGMPDCEKELRTAMAMGADHAIRVDAPPQIDPWNVARALVEIAKRVLPDLILMGKQAVDDDANQVGQFVAALLGWPQATFASRVDVSSWPRLLVSRETDAGMETVSLNSPAVVTADLRLNEPRYASLPSIMKARAKTIESIGCEELGMSWEPRVEIVDMQTMASQRNCVFVSSADELVDKLREQVKVL